MNHQSKVGARKRNETEKDLGPGEARREEERRRGRRRGRVVEEVRFREPRSKRRV